MNDFIGSEAMVHWTRRDALKYGLSFVSASWLPGLRGSWSLDTQPLGGMKSDEVGGLSRKELDLLLDEIADRLKSKPFVVTRAKWFAAVCSRVRLAMNPGDEFVHWHPDSDVLSARFRRRMKSFAESAPNRRCCGKWVEATNGAWIARLDTSHTCPDWESVLSLGVKGLADRARARLAHAKMTDERVFLDCVVEVYEAMRGLCRRWANYADSLGSAACAATLRSIAERPPQTFREALQLSLVYDRCQETEGECVRSQGLFDRLYLGFYRQDLAEGRETRQSAKRLLSAFFSSLYSQNHPNGKNIALGGYDETGKPVWNELTELVIETHYELNRPNPKLTFRLGERTPDWQLAKVTDCLAKGRTSVVFANEELLTETFRAYGKGEADICQYVLIGCYEPGIQGREIISSMSTEVNLAKPLETALNGGCDFAGRPLGFACEFPADVEAFEREYFRQLGHMISVAIDTTVECEQHWYELNPSPVMSGASRDAIAAARDCGSGGMRYNQSGVVFMGLATAVDSLSAVRYLVGSGSVDLGELSGILKSNWKGAEELRMKARRLAPKWGNGNRGADELGRRIGEFVCKAVKGRPNGHGGEYQPGLWSIDRDIPFGQYTGATADGRMSGDPLSRNNSATAGCGREGVTALLNAQMSLDQRICADGCISDVILPVVSGDGYCSSRLIGDLLRTYFRGGGQCIHFNCFSAKVLREAMADPKRYPDLQVRVCGWNVRWNDLSRIEQEHFIATAEAQE